MTDMAVSWTLEKCDSRRLKIILKCLMVCISTLTFIIGTNSEGEREKKQRLADIEANIEAGDIVNPSNLNVNTTRLRHSHWSRSLQILSPHWLTYAHAH